MVIQSIINRNSYQALALGTIAVLSIAILGYRFFSRKKVEPPKVEDTNKTEARKISPLVDKLDPKIPILWSDFVKNNGVFTVPGTSARIDLKNRVIQLQNVTTDELKAACKHIQGDIVCQYNNGNSYASKVHYYYRNIADADFVHIPPGPNKGSQAFPSNAKWAEVAKEIGATEEDKLNAHHETNYESLLKNKETIQFEIYDSRPAGFKI